MAFKLAADFIYPPKSNEKPLSITTGVTHNAHTGA